MDEFQSLKMEISESDKEKENAAKYGLKLLEEHNEMRRLMEIKDEQLETANAQLNSSQLARILHSVFSLYLNKYLKRFE